MIQLSNKNKILLLAGVIVLIIFLILLFLGIKKAPIEKNMPVTKNEALNSVTERPMTESEKINKVGIDPSQEAEVLKDKDGLYIYRLKK